MNENLRRKIVYACLILAVVWGVYNIDFKKDTAPIEQTQTSRSEINRTQDTESLSTSAIEEKKLLDWGQDPFRTKTTIRRTKPAGQWVLSGILYNKTSPLAYINAQPVRVGDTVDRAKVIEIEKDFVTLEYGGNKQKIFVLEG